MQVSKRSGAGLDHCTENFDLAGGHFVFQMR